ncbi:hypothetical protein GCK72_012825 [Caenorhabditis remanei]|uniref:Uncharacterized protein n=1 Tax=Caenorhabditis remanei TaxID=31234 RepID=A0A6A5GPM1_CAERE|nr:hypothetical protein GCK72_012825 [Caenorhabditis remanei]KAF1756372.1 hypothetical protein GCK72_012825 [Caenorhabditis remanei]
MNQHPNLTQPHSNNTGRGGRRNNRRTPKKSNGNHPDRPFSSASNHSTNQNGNRRNNRNFNRNHQGGEQDSGNFRQNNRDSIAPIDENRRFASQSARDSDYQGGHRDLSPHSHSARDHSDTWGPDDRRSYSSPRNSDWHPNDFENDGQGPSRIDYDDYNQGGRNSYSPPDNRQYENEDHSRRNNNYREEQSNNSRLDNQDSPPGNINTPSKKKKKRPNNTARWNKALKLEIQNANGQRRRQQRTPTKSEGPSAGRFGNGGYQESERTDQNHERRSRSPGYRNAPPPSYVSQDVRISGNQSRRPDSSMSSRMSRLDQNQDRYPDQRSQQGYSPVRSERHGLSEERFVNDNGRNSNDRNGDMFNGFGYRDSPPRYFEGFQSQTVRNDSRMSNRPNNHHSPPRHQDRFRSSDHYRSNSPSGRFKGSDAHNDQRRFENGNHGSYSPNPPNWQNDVRGRSDSPCGQGTSNFRENSWSPIPGERRCRSPSAQNGYSLRNRSPSPRGQGSSNWQPSPPREQFRNRSPSAQCGYKQIRNRSLSPYGQVNSNYHQDNWQPSPERFRNRSPSPGPRDDWSPIPGERRCRSPSRQYEDDTQRNPRNIWSPPQNWNNQQRNRSLSRQGSGPSTSRPYDDRSRAPSYQYDHSSFSPEGQGTSNYRQNCWSPSPAPALGQQLQERNRSGSLQGPGPSSHSRDNSWSPIPGERRYYRSPSPYNPQRRHSPIPQGNYRSSSVEPRLPVSGFQQSVVQLQNETRSESSYPNERQRGTPKDVELEPREEEEEEPFDEEERRELFAALMREEPMRRIEPSDGKWQLSITETSCDPSFLWDRPEPKGKVSQATRRFVTKDYVNPHLRNNCIFCNGKHKPDECPNVVSVEDRREILAFYKRCIRCLRRHREEPCPRKNHGKCYYCFDEDPEEPKHNSSVCRTAYIPEHMLESNQ